MEVGTPIRNLIDGQKLVPAELPLSSLTGEDDQGESLDYPDACAHCSHQEMVRKGFIRRNPRFTCECAAFQSAPGILILQQPDSAIACPQRDNDIENYRIPIITD